MSGCQNKVQGCTKIGYRNRPILLHFNPIIFSTVVFKLKLRGFKFISSAGRWFNGYEIVHFFAFKLFFLSSHFGTDWIVVPANQRVPWLSIQSDSRPRHQLKDYLMTNRIWFLNLNTVCGWGVTVYNYVHTLEIHHKTVYAMGTIWNYLNGNELNPSNEYQIWRNPFLIINSYWICFTSQDS